MNVGSGYAASTNGAAADERVAEAGTHSPGRRSGGRSMIVDPWGVVLAQAQDSPGVIVAELDLRRLASIRASLPSLANRRPGAYRWPA